VAEVEQYRTSRTRTGNQEGDVEGVPGHRNSPYTGGGAGAVDCEASPSGLSRMIRGLFPPSPSQAAGNRWSSHGVNPLRDRFTTRVARYLQGGSAQRDRLVAGILDDGASLSEAGEDQAVGQAFGALVRRATRRTAEGGPAGDAGWRSHGGDGGAPSSADEGGPGPDRDMLALAAELVGHRAATGVIEVLLATPDGEGASELLAVATALPERILPVLSDASDKISDPSVQQTLAYVMASARPSAGGDENTIREVGGAAIDRLVTSPEGGRSRSHHG